MTDPNHSMTRLWIRQGRQAAHGHITPGCSHDWGSSLCGIPSADLGRDDEVESVCPECLVAWRGGDSILQQSSIMLPRGEALLLRRSGALQRGPHGGRVERRAHAITRDLNALSPESLGTLGQMVLSIDHGGVPHGDRWCADYDGATATYRPVSIGDESVVPHHSGVALHCHRGLPRDIEDAFLAALAVCRARNGLLAVMGASGWGLYEAVRHEHGMHGLSDDRVCEVGGHEVESSLATVTNLLADGSVPKVLVREAARTREVWDVVSRLLTDWAFTEEARVELGRETLILALASGTFPAEAADRGESPVEEHSLSSAIQAVVQYGIVSGPYLSVLNVAQMRVALSEVGWTSPVPANKRVIEEEVLPRLGNLVSPDRAREVAEDLADFMVSQDHVFEEMAEHYMGETQDGVFLEIDAGASPAHWGAWPHGVDEEGNSLHWVPVPVAKVAALDDLGASLGPYLPMTSREARSVLGRAGRPQKR